MKFDPKELPVGKVHQLLLGSVAPRPIAFVSTQDAEGNVNLSPFSFFNVFSANPPIMIFSPARRVRDNTTKHTYDNLKVLPECVVNIVDFKMVEQMSLASCEYPADVDEFVKAGLTPSESELVSPPRVREAPAAFECKVQQIIELGQDGGAGNLIICEVLMMHIKSRVLDSHGVPDPFKMQQVARLGGDWYAKITDENLFKIAKPNKEKGMGLDQLPEGIRNLKIFSRNELARLANLTQLPSKSELEEYISNNSELAEMLSEPDAKHVISFHAKGLLQADRTKEALMVLMSYFDS